MRKKIVQNPKKTEQLENPGKHKFFEWKLGKGSELWDFHSKTSNFLDSILDFQKF